MATNQRQRGSIPVMKDGYPLDPGQNHWMTRVHHPIYLGSLLWDKIYNVQQAHIRPVRLRTGSNPGELKPDALIVCADALALEIENGAPKYGAGLMPADPNNKTTQCFNNAMTYTYRTGKTVIKGFDTHFDEDHVNEDALTGIVFNERYLSLLTPDHRVYVEKYLSHMIEDGSNPTVAEAEPFMGPASDVEFGAFAPHCIWNKFLFLPEVYKLIQEERKYLDKPDSKICPNCDTDNDLDAEKCTGCRRKLPEEINTMRLVLVPKRGLFLDNPPNTLGIGGNNFETLVNQAFRGIPDGGNYVSTYQRSVIMGTSLGYTLDLLAMQLIAMGKRVHFLLSSSFGLPVGQSKLERLRYLRMYYPNQVTASYHWPISLLGKAPAGYNDVAYEVLKEDRQYHANTDASFLTNTARIAITGAEIPVIDDWEDSKW